MKITIEQGDTKVSIENSDVSAEATINNLVIPALIGIGFHRDSILDAMSNASEESKDG